jgi:hypothetical protein
MIKITDGMTTHVPTPNAWIEAGYDKTLLPDQDLRALIGAFERI